MGISPNVEAYNRQSGTYTIDGVTYTLCTTDL
jgi:hypothetical protein